MDRIEVFVDEGEYSALKSEAKDKGVSLSEHIRSILLHRRNNIRVSKRPLKHPRKIKGRR